MSRLPAFASAALASLSLLACDPAYHAEGSVVGPDGKPILTATVTKVCPKPSSEYDDAVKVDAQGHFSYGGVGGSFDAPKCSLRIEAPGFQARTVSIKDVCYRNTLDKSTRELPLCKPTDGAITLTPAPK